MLEKIHMLFSILSKPRSTEAPGGGGGGNVGSLRNIFLMNANFDNSFTRAREGHGPQRGLVFGLSYIWCNFKL